MSRGWKSWLAIGAFVLAAASAGLVLAVASAAQRPSASSPSATNVVDGSTLKGDELLAGPVLLNGQAVWVEAGAHRLSVRSLDASGHTQTLFSTTKAAGAPKNAQWPFDVESIAAGAGKIAFVVRVMPCTSSPPRNPACPYVPGPAMPWDSSTVYAGPPNAIRPVYSVGRCAQPLEPWAVAVSSAGLIVDEEHDICPGSAQARVALRSFSGQFVAVLGLAPPRCRGCISPLRGAGPWAAFVILARTGELRIVRASTGQIVESLNRNLIGDVALDGSSSRFALLTPGEREPCHSHADFSQVQLGQIGQAGLRTLVSPAESNASATASVIALAGQTVAFLQPTGHCLAHQQVAVVSQGSNPVVVPGLAPGILSPIAFDGRLVAVTHGNGNTVQMTAIDCPAPSVPVPPNEPVYSPGPTELVAGLYIQGGAIPPPPCQPEPRGPYAGKITVTDSNTGTTVASQSVSNGQLAHIALSPGTYKVSGQFASGGSTTFSPTITVRQGNTVRQDVFEDVP